MELDDGFDRSKTTNEIVQIFYDEAKRLTFMPQ
jgi:hypothetical protein